MSAGTLFCTRTQIEYGERFKVVGNLPQLGSWDVAKAPELSWHDGDLWAASLDLPVGVDVEFKVGCYALCYYVTVI